MRSLIYLIWMLMIIQVVPRILIEAAFHSRGCVDGPKVVKEPNRKKVLNCKNVIVKVITKVIVRNPKTGPKDPGTYYAKNQMYSLEYSAFEELNYE